MNTGKVLLGVLAGVAAGALMGILFAPAKGSRTRRKILRQGESYVGGLEEKFNEYANTISGKLEHAKEEVSAFAQKGKEKLESAKEEVSAFAQKGKEKFEEAEKEVKTSKV